MASVADELKKLAELRDAGVLTEEEFDTQKAKLLGSHLTGRRCGDGHDSAARHGWP